MTSQKNDAKKEQKKLRPSEQLKEQRKRMIEEHLDAQIIKALPHLDEISTYLAEPEEIKVYILLNKDDETLDIAIRMFVDEFHREPEFRDEHFETYQILLDYYKRKRQEYEAEIEEEKLDERYKKDEDPKSNPFNLFKWKRILKYLETLSDNKARIAYLVRKKSDFIQLSEKWREAYDPEETFISKCDSEIEALKAANELGQNKDKERHIEAGTQNQILLAMYFLFSHLNAKGTITDKARFISFLTGFSGEKIRQLFPKVLEKANENWTAFEKDAQLVQNHFQKLGLSEIVAEIDEEIENISEDL